MKKSDFLEMSKYVDNLDGFTDASNSMHIYFYITGIFINTNGDRSNFY